MNTDWVEGRFEGIYSGPRRPSVAAGSGRDRSQRGVDPAELSRFEFEIESGHLREINPCRAPESDAPGDERVIRQHRLQHVRLTDADGTGFDQETSLYDVRVHDFELKYPAVAGDRAYGTIVGRLRARRRPAPPASAAVATIEDTSTRPAAEANAVGANLDPGPQQILNEDEETDASSELLESPGWALVMLLVLLVFVAIGTVCGFRSGVAWLVSVELALGLRWLMQGRLIGERPRWLSISLPLLQILVIWTPLEVAWQTGCWPVLGVWQLALVAVPMAFAAILGSRGSLWLTVSIWTLMLCSGCARTDATSCSWSRSNEVAARSGAVASETSVRRTDEDGRWPVMPTVPGAFSADPSQGRGRDGQKSGAMGGGGGGASDLGALARGTSGAEGAPEKATEMPFAAAVAGNEAAQGLYAADGTNAGDHATQNPASRSSASSPPSSPTSTPVEREKYRRSQVNGGWLSPEHRQTQRQQARISIEQANRTPALFFASGGARRVYVPSDPIFEDGSSTPRRNASLVLARIAALLSLPSKPRVMLEVHSDSAGIEESQVELSRRRAEFIRSWLVDRGHVAAGRFDVMPIGGGQPLVPPDGDYGAQQPNRRIEIRLIEEEGRGFDTIPEAES